MEKTKVFVSFYHKDIKAKEEIVKLLGDQIISKSVEDGDIEEGTPDEKIRKIIRDDYLKTSTVTIVLVGEDTSKRKHVDWEIYSSMYENKEYKHYKSGILAIDLSNRYWLNKSEMRAQHGLSSGSTATKESIKRNIGHFPDRLKKNILKEDVVIRIATYSDIIQNKSYLLELIEEAKTNKETNKYNLEDRMRRKNG